MRRNSYSGSLSEHADAPNGAHTPLPSAFWRPEPRSIQPREAANRNYQRLSNLPKGTDSVTRVVRTGCLRLRAGGDKLWKLGVYELSSDI
jgi:hypothetical protein